MKNITLVSENTLFLCNLMKTQGLSLLSGHSFHYFLNTYSEISPVK